tara:strand:+ start:210 stop:647 length:438 start_codon:yes stop_codon:yes gene_type:complete
MSTYHKGYSVGLQNVGSYQVSGIPYITGSTTLGNGAEHEIRFPTVARTVTVMSHTAAPAKIRIHFHPLTASLAGNHTTTSNVEGGLHYVELDSDEDSITMNVKCSEIYISAPKDGQGNREYRVIAELTNIPRERMFQLSGSGISS